jgi:hypothetical protein
MYEGSALSPYIARPSIGCACRVEREGEQAFVERRHGHPTKLRGDVLIPTCILRGTSKMREVGHRPEAVRIGFQLIESLTHLINYLIERGKGQIRQVLFAHFFPDMFDVDSRSGL